MHEHFWKIDFFIFTLNYFLFNIFLKKPTTLVPNMGDAKSMEISTLTTSFISLSLFSSPQIWGSGGGGLHEVFVADGIFMGQ